MRPSAELRAAVQTIGNAAVGVGLGLSMLWVAVVVSQFAAAEGTAGGSASPASPSTLVVVAASATAAASSAAPSAAPISSAPSPLPTASPTAPPPTATPTPLPSATAQPLTVEPYSNGGRRYAALTAPVGYVYLAPFAGTVQVRTYQLIEGEVRVGSFVPSLPFFPYVTVESADRRVIFRPGALNTDTEMLIKDGERAEPGTPLFKTVGEGASSWRTFYDRRVAANVIVSVAALPSGAEVDPVRFLNGP